MGETKTIKTPSGKEAVLKIEMTARDFRELKGMWLKDVVIEGTDSDNPKLSGLKGTIIEEVENKAIELMVVSFDGSKDDILNRLLDLPYKDYEVIFNEVSKLTGDLGQKKTD